MKQCKLCINKQKNCKIQISIKHKNKIQMIHKKNKNRKLNKLKLYKKMNQFKINNNNSLNKFIKIRRKTKT